VTKTKSNCFNDGKYIRVYFFITLEKPLVTVGCLKITVRQNLKTQTSDQTWGSRFNPKRRCYTPTNMTWGSCYMPNTMVVI